MQKVLYSLLVIGIVTSIAGGSGAIAYFNDTETSPGNFFADNTFTAGTLNLRYQLDPGNNNYGPWQDGSVDTFDLNTLVPGDSGYVRYKLHNQGSTTGYVEVSSLSASHTEGANPESEISDPDTDEADTMDEELRVLIWFDADDDGYVDTYEKLVYANGDDGDGVAEGDETITDRPIEDLSGFKSDSNIPLAANALTHLRTNWNIPSTVGNDTQGDIATVDIDFELAQTAGQ